MEFTIMTYATYLGDVTSGASNERYGFAQTLMMYDIAALQYMYGANFTTHAGASVYRWDPLTGEMFIREDGGAFVGQGRPGGPDAPNDGTANRVFLTIWDGDGIDTYDMSNYTNGVSIDLRPGQWSITSASQLANLNGYYANNPIYAHGNVYNALQYEGDTRSLIENAIGGAGNDTLMGNDADNTLDGGAGIDSMAGGNGNDTYIVDNVLDEVLEAADAGIDTVRSSVTYTLTTNVEDLILIGKATIHGTGNALDNVITGNTAGNVLDGGDGNDTLYGGGGLDTLIGGFGDDWLDGGLYTDSMVGGDGNDTYIVDNFLDKVIEAAGVGSGIDTVMSSVTYTLTANVENLILIGSATINGTGNTLDNAITGNGATNLLRGGDGNDTMDGAGGNDYLYGENDSDSLDGGNGNDLLDGGAGNDTLAGGAGLDTLIGGEGDDRLLGEGGNDSLTGGNGNDFLNGGAASDYLNGGAGDDELKGGNGNDTLIGGAGNDTLDGGDGSDLFVFDTTPGVTNVDLILNFNAAEDTIQLQRYWSFSGLSGTGTLGAGAFWSGAGLSAAHDGNDRIVFDTSSGALYYDADGAGGTAAVQFATVDLITLTGAITNVDFLVV
ncbi:MAG: hypothetical protein IAE92_14590 [Burkholderiaceae bacterium]|nr:hypothetical protein [Burkholderiaceae bacterium]